MFGAVFLPAPTVKLGWVQLAEPDTLLIRADAPVGTVLCIEPAGRQQDSSRCGLLYDWELNRQAVLRAIYVPPIQSPQLRTDAVLALADPERR